MLSPKIIPPKVVPLIMVAMVAFILHLIWEIAQCKLFFVHGTLPLTITSMLGAIFGDIVLTGMAFVLTFAVTKDIAWIYRRWTIIHWLSMEIAALALSISIEKIGLWLNRWSYTPITPLLPLVHVSLLPVLQLVILFPLTFAVAAKLQLSKLRERVTNGK